MRILGTIAALALGVCPLAAAQPAAPAPPPAPPLPVVVAPPTDPDHLPGSDPEVNDAPPPPRYPLALTERPLDLPSGAFEISPTIHLTHRTELDRFSGDVTGHPTDLLFNLGARVGIGRFEVSAHTTLGVLEIENDDTNQTGFNVASAGLSYNFAGDSIVELAFSANASSELVQTYYPHIVVATKLHPSPRSAIALEAFGGDDRYVYDPEASFHSPPSDLVVLGTEVTAEAQITPNVGVEAWASFALYHELDPDRFNDLMAPDATYGGQHYGIEGVIAMAPGADMILGIDLVASGNAYVESFLGFAFRRVP